MLNCACVYVQLNTSELTYKLAILAIMHMVTLHITFVNNTILLHADIRMQQLVHNVVHNVVHEAEIDIINKEVTGLPYSSLYAHVAIMYYVASYVVNVMLRGHI